MRLWTAVPAVTVAIFLASPALSEPVSRDTPKRVFEPFDWLYEFDGTDAALSGLAEMPATRWTKAGPKLFIRFVCSKHSISVELSPNEFDGDPVDTNVSVYLNKSRFLDDTAFRGRPFSAVIAQNDPSEGFVSAFAEFTQELYHDESIELKIASPQRVASFDMQRGNYDVLEHREAIASFRQQCSTWWSDF